jgi:septum formation protein
MQKNDLKANTKDEDLIILGSGSPRRRELLGTILSDFEVFVSDADELTEHMDGPISLVQENARLKALSVSDVYPNRWVLGADTLVFLENQVLGKPKSMEEANSMLKLLSGKTHTVSTGICFVNQEKGYVECRVGSSLVSFKVLNDQIIKEYFKEVNPLDKAGAYAIQTRPDLIIDRFKGSRTNVIGLPIELLVEWMEELKFPLKKSSV